MKVIEQKKTCGICEQDRQKGIHVYNLFICCECEQKVIQTEPNDENYKYYLEKLKGINQPTLYS